MARYLQFAGDGRFVIIGVREGLLLLHADTLAKVTTLFHQGVILAGMTPNGQRAVTMARDNSIRIWDIGTGLETTRLTAEDPARALALSNNGRWLAALHGEGEGEEGEEISLWALGSADLVAQSCRWLETPCP
jgi:WD40 repeat protein